MTPDPISSVGSALSELDRVQARANACQANVLAQRIAGYRRERDLPNLLRITPEELADTSPKGRQRIIARLERSIRADQNAIREGHWTWGERDTMGKRAALVAERKAIEEREAQSEVGAELFKSLVTNAPPDSYAYTPLPPLDESLHTEALIAELQHPAMMLDAVSERCPAGARGYARNCALRKPDQGGA